MLATTFPTPSAIASATLAMLGFGVFVGAIASPHAADATARRVVVVQVPPAAAARPDPKPAPAASEADDVKADAGDAGSVPVEAPAPLAPEPVPAAPAPATDDTTSSGDAPATTPAPVLPPVKHVWVVALTGHGFDEVLAPGSPATYLRDELRPKGVLFSGWTASGPGPLASNLTLLSGRRATPPQRIGCPAYEDGPCLRQVRTVLGQLTEAGRTWRAYVENGTGCKPPEPGMRNPLLYFREVVDSPDCVSNTAEPDRLAPDAEDSESAPSFSLIVPDACHDGRDQPCAEGAPAGLAAADAWLRQVLPPLLGSKAYADGGAVFITFDAKPGEQEGGTTGALLLSPLAPEGAEETGAYGPANLLRTVEDLFSLDPLGGAREAKALHHTFTVAPHPGND